MPDFQKTPGGLDLRMVTPAELLLDPERTKNMTADDQRDMIQQLYNEQVRMPRKRHVNHNQAIPLSGSTCAGCYRKAATKQEKDGRPVFDCWWLMYQEAAPRGCTRDTHVTRDWRLPTPSRGTVPRRGGAGAPAAGGAGAPPRALGQARTRACIC